MELVEESGMKRAIRTLKEFSDRITKDHVGAYAAQGAFFLLLSFIPFMMLLLNIVQYTSLTETEVSSAVLAVIPQDFHGIVSSVIEEIYRRSSVVLPVSAVLALWSAGKAVNSLTYGFNTIYQVQETRNYFLNRLRSMGYTLIFLIAILVTLGLLVFGKSLQRGMAEFFPAAAGITALLISFRTIITIAALLIAFLLLYRFIPNRKDTLGSQLPGALVATVAWEIMSVGFSIYLEYFPGVTKMYGSMTTMILLMLWVYFCMYIILLGAEINEYYDERMQKELDSEKNSG